MKDASRQPRLFAVATPYRTTCDDMARVLERANKLRFIALGTRRGIAGVPLERTRLKPIIGLASYIAAKTLSQFWWESFRYRLLPWFDHWALKQLVPGDHVVSSYGYANECFRFARRHGGKTLIDAGNSHIEHFYEVISEEHRRWNCPLPPMPPYWYERSKAMLAETDYVFSPSSYVTRTFLERGFKPEQILKNIYPVDLSVFEPPTVPRPKDRPLTIISTGSLSLRKGTPYLLEAFRLVRQKHPSARLLLMRIIQNDIEPVLERYRDLPIEWSPGLAHPQLAAHLRSADVFVLPSLEDGFARTVTEALSCGLPVITTPNTGASDLVQPGVNGEIVPIRDAPAIADAVLKWAEKILSGNWQPRVLANLEPLSFEYYEREFVAQLTKLGLL